MRIASGGQTGADRGALEAAIALGLPVAGWCPRGRMAEDGAVPGRYPLSETPRRSYAQRTGWNVRDSDATLVCLRGGGPRGGTRTTLRFARRWRRPFLIVDLGRDDPGRRRLAAGATAAWIRRHRVRRLNVAGPRESEAPGIEAAARAFLLDVLGRLRRRR